MERLRELTMVGAIVLGVITCSPQEVEGGIARHVGVWCHGASTAPHYFHSRMATIVLDPPLGGVGAGDPRWGAGS